MNYNNFAKGETPKENDHAYVTTDGIWHSTTGDEKKKHLCQVPLP